VSNETHWRCDDGRSITAILETERAATESKPAAAATASQRAPSRSSSNKENVQSPISADIPPVEAKEPLKAIAAEKQDALYVYDHDGEQFIGPLAALCTALFGQRLHVSNALRCLDGASKLKVNLDTQTVAPPDAHTSRSTGTMVSAAGLAVLMQTNASLLETNVCRAVFEALEGPGDKVGINPGYGAVFIASLC
jgi:hypothetical protein